MDCRHVLRMDPFPHCISVKSKESLDPARIRLLRPRGVMLSYACFMNLIEKLHGCIMEYKDGNVNKVSGSEQVTMLVRGVAY